MSLFSGAAGKPFGLLADSFPGPLSPLCLLEGLMLHFLPLSFKMFLLGRGRHALILFYFIF